MVPLDLRIRRAAWPDGGRAGRARGDLVEGGVFTRESDAQSWATGPCLVDWVWCWSNGGRLGHAWAVKAVDLLPAILTGYDTQGGRRGPSHGGVCSRDTERGTLCLVLGMPAEALHKFPNRRVSW